MKSTVLATFALLTAAGCYAPLAKTTPSVGDGVRVSAAEGACHAPRVATQELASEDIGEVYARVKIENQSDRALTFDPRSVWVTYPALQPWTWQDSYVVEPRSDRTLTMRLSSHQLRCDRELNVSFANSLYRDGQAVAVTPLRIVPHDAT